MLKDVRLGGALNPARLRVGVYENCGFNFANAIDRRGWEDFFDDEAIPSYGVVDSIDQLFEKFGATIEASPLGHAVGFTEVRRGDQPSDGGWRWHKWGKYHGTREPRCEYLHDEPEIESVMTFSVVREAK